MSGGAALIAVLATALLTGCSSQDGDAPEVTPSAAPTTTTPESYGAPVDPELPEPSVVAVDPEPSPAPVGAGSIRVTYADWNAESRVVEAGGILPDVVEADGVCTLTLTKDAVSVSATVTALPDARSTNCGGLVIAGESLSAGSWTAVIDYRSARSEASSEPAQVQIP